MAELFLDVALLREHPQFRRMWAGTFVSNIGTQLSTVAISYEIYHLTRSDLDVGLIGLAQLVPAFFGSAIGGAVADAIDRRKVLAATGSAMGLFAAGMAVDTTGAHPSILLLYLLAGSLAGVQGANNPAQTALIVSMVGREDLMKANVLRQLSNQMSIVLGPALGGVAIATLGVDVAFWLNALSYVAPVVAVLTIGPQPVLGGATRFGWTSIAEGFSFLKGRKVLQGCIWSDLNATVLGWPTALFPAMAVTHLHGGAKLTGLLYAAPGAGAVIGAALSGWTTTIRRAPRAMRIGIVAWGTAVAAFGVAPDAALAIGFLAVAGAADMVTTVFRTTVIQTEIPDRLRGRVTAVQMALLANGPRLGNTEAGLVASVSSTQLSVISGGLGCIVGIAIISRLLPEFIDYELPRHGAVELLEP